MILSVLIFCCLFLAAVLGVQLRRTRSIEPSERIAASRMCYYLLLAVVVYVSASYVYASVDVERRS